MVARDHPMTEEELNESILRNFHAMPASLLDRLAASFWDCVERVFRRGGRPL
jgi:hypothetical protein